LNLSRKKVIGPGEKNRERIDHEGVGEGRFSRAKREPVGRRDQVAKL